MSPDYLAFARPKPVNTAWRLDAYPTSDENTHLLRLPFGMELLIQHQISDRRESKNACTRRALGHRFRHRSPDSSSDISGHGRRAVAVVERPQGYGLLDAVALDRIEAN